MTHTRDEQSRGWNIPIKPKDDVPGLRLELWTPDNETIDDLIDSLWRHGSAQDYPPPVHNTHVPPPPGQPHVPSFREDKSQPGYQLIDQPPVPGYRNFSKLFANVDFGGNHAQHISQTSKAHGRRRA